MFTVHDNLVPDHYTAFHHLWYCVWRRKPENKAEIHAHKINFPQTQLPRRSTPIKAFIVIQEHIRTDD